MSIYDINVMNTDGVSVSLDKYRGKVLLIVNTATECGFTPQYEPTDDMKKNRYRNIKTVEQINIKNTGKCRLIFGYF